MTDEFIVDVQDLSKSFNGKPAVQDVSLKVKRGEIYGFLGPNGSGKTTTLRMLCGLLNPDQGKGTCMGYDILHQTNLIKYKVGYVPQTFSLYKDLTVKENLEFIAKVYEERNYKERARNFIHELNLKEYENILAGNLSGGTKQRLSLAAALIHTPQLLLLDEPTAGVDPKARRDFWNYISYLTSKGMTALVSTHYMDEAERCNRLAYIVSGKLMVEGNITDILHKIKLITFSASGKNLGSLSESLKEEKGIEQVIAWGNELRVCSTDMSSIEKVIELYPNYKWRQVDTSLEEVFIHLVNMRAHENKEI